MRLKQPQEKALHDVLKDMATAVEAAARKPNRSTAGTSRHQAIMSAWTRILKIVDPMERGLEAIATSTDEDETS